MVEILSSNDNGLSLGQYLKKVRSEKLITVEEIASVTKISLNLLTALENDVLEELPAVPFVKGFIKSYARYVGIDPKQALNIYEQNKPTILGENQPIDKLSERKGISLDRLRMSKYSYLLITIVLIFSLTVFALLIIKGLKSGESGNLYNSPMVVNIKKSNEPNFSQVNPLSNVQMSNIQNSSDLFQVISVTQQEEAVKKDKVQPVIKEESKKEIVKTKEEPKTKLETQVETKINDETKVQEELKKVVNQDLIDKEQSVDIVAKENVWVKIQTDETTPTDFILKTGQIKNVKGLKEIKMLFGDAAAVSLKYNGRVIETLGEKGTVRSLVFPGLGRWKGESLQ